jgi:hypothetical protein
MLVGLNPQVFYLEDDEVVAVTDCAQRVQSAAFFLNVHGSIRPGRLMCVIARPGNRW